MDNKIIFKKGNIVRVAESYWGGKLNESQDDVGLEYVIEYSYGEKFGNGENDGRYSIIDMKTGYSSSWWESSKLEFVAEGSENLIIELHELRLKSIEKESDINWIKDNWGSANIGSISIIQLFKEVSYETSFEKNGEYFALQCDWAAFQPIFNDLFKNAKDSMIDRIKSSFKAAYIDFYIDKFSVLFQKIHNK